MRPPARPARDLAPLPGRSAWFRSVVAGTQRARPLLEVPVDRPPASRASALALLMAAAVALVGGAGVLAAGRALQVGGPSGEGRATVLLVAVVILLGAAGVVLVALAGYVLLRERRRSRRR